MTGQARHPAMDIAATLRRAMIAHQNGRLEEAEPLYRQILAADPGQFDALQMLGILETQCGRLEEGRKLLVKALKVNPQAADAHCNLGRVLRSLGERRRALECTDKGLAINPGLAVGWSNRGAMLRELGRHQEALESYDRALRLEPHNLDILFNRGNVLLDLRRPADALAAFDATLARHPKYVDGWIGRACALDDMDRPDDALAAFNAAVAAQPNHAESYRRRGELAMSRKSFGNAAADFATALRLDGNCKYVLGNLVHCRMQTCDWAGLDEAWAGLAEQVHAGAAVATPFALLAAHSSGASQLRCARTFVADRYPREAAAPVPPDRRHDRIRVAYVSADLREHAVAFLAAGLFEQHDRSRFETTAISLDRERTGPFLDRLKAGFDRFVAAADKTDSEVVALMRELEIDIAIDLMGHTRNARTGILAGRPAPIQVNYLGYPGTTGADFIDYIVADPFVIPNEAESCFSEKVVRLPDAFLVSDSKRDMSQRAWTRAEAGLPEQGVVYCAFNATYKISPQIFAVWMRLLGQVDGSVLWLGEGNEPACRNLMREAENLGIDSRRLVFARRVEPNADHLARCRLADVFLDTPHYNGHSTAVDMLWAGVPVLTLVGQTFAGRVAGSLLRAIGLPELLSHSLSDYEALAVRLGRNPDLLAQIKAKLADNRLTHPLFNTERFTRHLEAAYLGMWEQYCRGEKPTGFSVAPIG